MAERNFESLQEEPKKVTITPQEYELIRSKKTVGYIYTLGFLVTARREELSIEDTYNLALAQPHQEEHHDAYRRARDFFVLHAEDFGIEVTISEKSNS